MHDPEGTRSSQHSALLMTFTDVGTEFMITFTHAFSGFQSILLESNWASTCFECNVYLSPR